MSKLDRRTKAIIKQKRRILIHSRNGKYKLPEGMKHKLKTMSTPCSCDICSPSKNIETGSKKREYKEKNFYMIIE